ncbi:MAG: LD-carboxypeptidase [Candidatus Latescibacteria bacterium]|nr:LD-carboxypeptidase [Candidatus Latescibacterota bacterium]
MHPITPPKLHPKSTLGIVSPSGSFSSEHLQPALTYLRDRGFKVCEGQALYAQDRYLAGTDEERANDLNTMFANPEIDAIFVSRGGYGSARLLDGLDWEIIGQNPKPLIGLSDTTALQLGLFAKTGLVSYSGLALCSDITPNGIDPVTEKAVWNVLCDQAFEPVEGLKPIREGNFSGPLIGGCLSLVTSLVGTSYLPSVDNAIIFLEDVNEPPYRIDRMLNQLRMAGVFDTVSGVVFGQFMGGEPDEIGEGSAQNVLEDFADRVACPVYTNLPYGHQKSRRVMPVGLKGEVRDGRMVVREFNRS